MKKSNFVKLSVTVLAAVLLFGNLFGLHNSKSGKSCASMQESIAGKILRFHVIANSDREEDQALKLKVRDEVLAYMQPLLQSCETQQESENVLQAHLTDIQAQAEAVVRKEGSTADVTAMIQTRYFPVKNYGEFTFPEGDYEALCIEIGKAEGKNWWCVLYPKLCFVDSLYAVVPDESKKELKTLLTPEEYEAILKSDEKVVVKSKLLETIRSLFE